MPPDHFGRKSHIENISLVNGKFTGFGDGVYADFRITKYGCRIYEISFGPVDSWINDTGGF
jgi:hypothetical protein